MASPPPVTGAAAAPAAPRAPELLAPGGDPDAVRAAILAGADAVYLGLGRFNARMRATNLDLAEVRALCRLARSHGVRVYVTLNVVFREGEIAEAAALGRAAFAAGADALIVQDLGLLGWFRRHQPDAELHASTQLTTHDAAQLEVLARAGVHQVNLGRELALDEVRALTARAHGLGLRVEVFVHGAYCVSFSGQCYLSSFLTGHSGNRGECVQPCRRAFHVGPASAPGYPLNLKDNNALGAASALLDAGVDALKIEGRRKGFHYVYTTVRAWRERLDALRRGAAPRGDDPAVGRVFNRGFSIGYLEGHIDRDMFAADGTDHSLRYLGEVASYTADTHTLRCAGAPPLRPGMRAGVFTRDSDYVAQFVVEAREAPDRFRVRLEHELKGRLERGQRLCALAEPAEAEAILARARALEPRRRPLAVRVWGAAGEPLRARFTTGGATAEAASAVCLAPAQRAPLDPDQLARHLGKLGETDFVLETVDASALAPGLFLPVSELNRVRQTATTELARCLAAPASRPAAAPALTPRAVPWRQRLLFLTDSLATARELRSLVGDDAAVGYELQGPEDPVLEDPDPDLGTWLAPLFPAIVFDAQLPAYEAALTRRRWRFVWSDNLGLGARAHQAGLPWLAGGLLNVANADALVTLAGLAGAGGAVVSPELDLDQIRRVGAAAAGTGLLRLATVHGPVLALQTRQCLVRDFKECGLARVEPTCLATCRAAGPLALEGDARFHAVKRPWFHSQLWQERGLCCPEAIAALGDAVDGVVVDLRDPGFLARPAEVTRRLARGFAEAVAHGRATPDEAARLRRLAAPATAGALGRTGGEAARRRPPRGPRAPGPR